MRKHRHQETHMTYKKETQMTFKTRRAAGFLLAISCAATVLAADVQSAAYAPETVQAIKIQPDKAPDCSSLKSIVDSVTRGCTNNDAKAIAIYNFILLTHFHCPYASEPSGIGALKEINVYGWGVCGGTHAVQSALWRELGWGWRFIGWPGHTTVEAQYDGRWHYFDAFLKWYAWIPDGKGGQTVASEEELDVHRKDIWDGNFVFDPGRKCGYFKDDQPMQNGKPNWQARDLLSCDYWMLEKDKDGNFKGSVPKAKDRHGSGSPEGWIYNHASGDYSTEVNLASGFSLINTWDAIPGAFNWGNSTKPPEHSCGGYADTRNSPGLGLVLEPYNDPQIRPKRTYANGTLSFVPDFANAGLLKSFLHVENVKYANKTLVPLDPGKPAYVVVRLASPYVITKAGGQVVGAATVELSTDDGMTFAAADLKDFTAPLKNKYSVQLKLGIKEALSALKVDLTVENNSCALPYLSPGKNKVAITVADPKALADNKLVVTFAYRLGSRAKSLDDVIASGKRIAGAIGATGATWSDQVTVVRKVFAARDLPATVEIDCPTPKGKYPVYPRMLFVSREVISSSGTPQPLPANAVAAKPLGSDEELATLPNPFLLGITPPTPAAKP